MNSSKISLRQAVVNEVRNLNGMAVPKKKFVEKITEKYPQFTPHYVKWYLRKCVVNNPNRVRWTMGVDLFEETSNHYLVSNTKYFTKYYPRVTTKNERT